MHYVEGVNAGHLVGLCTCILLHGGSVVRARLLVGQLFGEAGIEVAIGLVLRDLVLLVLLDALLQQPVHGRNDRGA